MFMYSNVLITLGILLYTAYASESSEELAEILSSKTGTLQEELKKLYENDKLELIAAMINSINGTEPAGSIVNFTVVGTQNVHNADGSLKEVRTIELFMPTLEKTSAISELKESTNQEEDEDDDEDDFNISNMIQKFRERSLTGLELELSVQELSHDPIGKPNPKKKPTVSPRVTSAFYITPELMFALNEGVMYINKTIEVDSVQEVNEKIKALKEDKTQNLPVAVLKYAGSGEFLSEKSNIIPELLAYIKEIDGEVSPKMQNEILHAVVKSSLQNPKNSTQICKDIVTDLESKFPGARFLIIFDEADGIYIKKDFTMEVAFAFTDMDEDDYVYKVYGLLPTTQSKM